MSSASGEELARLRLIGGCILHRQGSCNLLRSWIEARATLFYALPFYETGVFNFNPRVFISYGYLVPQPCMICFVFGAILSTPLHITI